MVLIQSAAKKKRARRDRFLRWWTSARCRCLALTIIFLGCWFVVVALFVLLQFRHDNNDGRSMNASSTQQQQQQQLRTLVVLTGNLRGGELAWDSLYRNLLDCNSKNGKHDGDDAGAGGAAAVVDLALLIGDTPPRYQNATLFQRARYVWRVPEYDDWADALDGLVAAEAEAARSSSSNGSGSSQNQTASAAAAVAASSWREPFFRVWKPGSHNILMGPLNGTKGSGAIVFAHRWFLMQKIRQQQHDDLRNRYDRFVVTRADHYYLCRHDLDLLDNDYIWIPSGSNYFGVCDRHMIVPSRYVVQALNVLPPIVLHPERYRDALTAVYSNTEQMLQRRLREQGLWSRVRRYRRTLFTCAAPGGDATRFRKASSDVTSSEGVQVKYHLEYRTSKVQCRRAFLNSWLGRRWTKAWIEVPQEEEES